MNLILSVKTYIDKMIRESEHGYKIMLMDKDTTSIVSIVYSMSEVMSKEVYMFERVDQRSSGENLSFLKCLVFVRPTANNIAHLCQELKKPRYGSYYLYFSNVVSKSDIKLLAEADENEVIKEVQELYADYLAHSPQLFSLNIQNCRSGNHWLDDSLQQNIHGLTSVLFSLQLLPKIRYRKKSNLCKILAERVQQTLLLEGSLYSGTSDQKEAVLLILDRRDDPVSPLLHQWTYEAMVHELLNINNGRVNLSHLKDVSEELKEVIMTPTQDDLYARCMYLNYGEIGQTFKSLMDDYQKKLSKQQKVETLNDMKHFVENYPQFKKMSGTVYKHVTIASELSRQVISRDLYTVSDCQQELVCGTEHSAILQRIHELIRNPKVCEMDAVKLAMLYAIRHEQHQNSDVRGLVNALQKRNIQESHLKCLTKLLEYGGQKARQNDLFDSNRPQDVIKKKLIKGLRGVENVYTQHKPLLYQVAKDALSGTLSGEEYAHTDTHTYSTTAVTASNTAIRPHILLLYVIGGVTYEEAAAIHQLNVSTPSAKVLLGGSCIHNSSSFLKAVEEAMDKVPSRSYRL